MPLQATSGAASYDAFGGGVPVVPIYIEEVFGTFLYTGNDTVQTITNGIDLSTKGGAVFIKSRNLTSPTVVYDTNRGINKALCTNLTNAENVGTLGTNQDLNSFNTNGFAVNLFTNAGGGFGINNSAHNLASWTFRKQPKFFDVVTWTGNGVAGRQIPHNLGSVPACIIVKNLELGTDWIVYHRGANGGVNPEQYSANLNTTGAFASGGEVVWGDGTTAFPPTSTYFTVYSSNALNRATNLNTYVAYVFAHNAGGFGLTGTDNVISCGSYTGNGAAGNSINLGYEPQWILIKRADSATGGAWMLQDNMRGFTAIGSSGDAQLNPNTSSAETAGIELFAPTATGFTTKSSGYNISSGTYIYIAIRRGPMKVPTSGTSVFSPISITPSSGTVSTTNFPVDFMITTEKTTGGTSRIVHDKLRGVGTVGAGNARALITNDTTAEFAGSSVTYNWWNTGFTWGAGFAGEPMVAWNFKRAPSFFDEVCYTGTGVSGRDISHNLSASPEMVIIKARSRVDDWVVRSSAFPTHGVNGIAYLNLTIAASDAGYSYVPTSTTFQVEANQNQNGSGNTYVAYLFATCAGVSKVGSYTGNGSSQTINCGFTGGARFVLIKKTSGTGDWMISDSARGIVSGSDPYLELNNTNAEVTGEDWLDTDSTGFVVNEVSGSNANTSSATYIFLAIA